ncbi:MAG: hypothetical protein ABSH22_08675 [Tepidisphaeraceae bacterium]|jgi:hypothetical protein
MKLVSRAVAMTLVATALCADRAVAAPRDICPGPETKANLNLVERLSVNLRRVVRPARIVEVRREKDRPAVAIVNVSDCPIVARVSLSPFQFRMPPPVI